MGSVGSRGMSLVMHGEGKKRMADENRRKFVKYALLSGAAAVSALAEVRVRPNDTPKVAGSRVSVGLSEANAACGSAYNCAGGGGQCGSAYNCSGGGGQCGSAYNCAGGQGDSQPSGGQGGRGRPSGGGQCGSAYNCSGGGGQCGSAYDCAGGGGQCGSAYNCSGS